MGVTCPQSGYTSERTNLRNSQHEALTGQQIPNSLVMHSRMAQAASVRPARPRQRAAQGRVSCTQTSQAQRLSCAVCLLRLSRGPGDQS